jgi:hypothetical protein
MTRWHVCDFRSVDRKRRAVPIGDWRGEARTFAPVNGADEVLVYSFGPVVANPLGASARTRMDSGGVPMDG